MRKCFSTPTVYLFFPVIIFSQSLIIHINDGSTYNVPLSEIDSITYTISSPVNNTVTDIDGNIYNTVQIGNQEWMAENLRVTHYRDGTAITIVTDNTAWSYLSTEAYCINNNNESNEVDTYGALYNWYAVSNSSNIAPEGWHVPTHDDWIELEMYLGMSESDIVPNGSYRGTNEGSKLAGYNDLWMDGGLETNSEFGSSGFAALPHGYRYHENGGYYGIGYHNYFWSSTEFPSGESAFRRGMSYDNSGIYADAYYKRFGCAVRLVRD